ncbi:MAG: hypothetical protein RI894_166, partial [Bacteroidota bacterium]
MLVQHIVESAWCFNRNEKMKNIITSIALTILSFQTNAQNAPWNLVNNYSFEDLNYCNYNTDPIDTNQTNPPVLKYWYSPATFPTSDYFNVCFQIPPLGVNYYSVPDNTFSFQYAYGSGSAFIGIFASNPADSGEYREYVQTKLRKQLKKNKKYCVGMYANLAFDPNKTNVDVRATKDLSLLLSKVRPHNDNIDPFASSLIIDTPQVSANNYITDTLNWTPIIGIVTAQGGEKWLTLGNFKPNMQTDIIDIYHNPHSIYPMCYYFIDNVFVIPMENEEALLHKDTAICANNFPLQLTANQGFTDYEWNNGTQSSSIQINQAGTYTVSATYAGCTIIDTIQVKLK